MTPVRTNATESVAQVAPNTSSELSANWNALPVDVDAVVLTELTAAQRRGVPLKAIAADAGIKDWRLYEINEGKKKLSVAEAPGFMRAIASTVLLEALARSVGAIVFFLKPVSAGGHGDLYQAFEDAVEDLAAISKEKRAALADDGVIDTDEAARIVGRIERAQATLESYKALVRRKAVARPDLRAVSR